jgi:hypothetical protein
MQPDRACFLMDEAAEEPAGPWGPGIPNIEAARAHCCISNKSRSCCLLTCEANVRRGFKFVPRSEPEFPRGSVACQACSNKYTAAKAAAAAAKAEAHAKRTRSDFPMQEDVSQKSPKLDRTTSRTPLSVQSSSTETPSATRDERPLSARELESSALRARLQRELADKDSELEALGRVIKEQGKAIASILRVLDTPEPDETVLASLRIAASRLSVDAE